MEITANQLAIALRALPPVESFRGDDYCIPVAPYLPPLAELEAINMGKEERFFILNFRKVWRGYNDHKWQEWALDVQA
ncbi:hypothetical protein [Zhongshania sp.]|uniref:hypothetical protein n=1 Tax=Zhongshania sp. TaxID=1971902 RepID=UPI00356821EA